MAEVLNQEQVLVNEDTLTLMADFIRYKLGEETIPTEEGFVKYTPMELANKIGNEMPLAKDAIPYYAKQFSGDNCHYLFAYGNWDWFIEQCGEEIYTEYLKGGEGIFYASNVKEILFTLNFSPTNSIPTASMFYMCSNLERLPNITGRLYNFYNFCGFCYKLKEIPEQWAEGIDWDYTNASTNWQACRLQGFFNCCYSLRKVPKALVKRMYGASNSSNAVGLMFYMCLTLDELEGIRGPNTIATSNSFSSNFNYCQRLKRLVFDYEDETTNTPRTENWKGQTIDLSVNVGYAASQYKSHIWDYNSGITADKEVKDDATYQALKNDKDWFTIKPEYSRYNHDSAVETINSLPDTSAYLAANGGTNTIKFKGAAGSATDGGAINTLTEAEIAVATAKGWTVSLV